jgi:hypothetical protein
MPKQDTDNRGNSTRPLTAPTALVTSRGHNDHIDTGVPRDSGLPRLNEKQLAERWGVSVRTLQAARVKGGGVPFVRIGSRAVRYRLEDVLAYEQARLRTNTSETL